MLEEERKYVTFISVVLKGSGNLTTGRNGTDCVVCSAPVNQTLIKEKGGLGVFLLDL